MYAYVFSPHNASSCCHGSVRRDRTTEVSAQPSVYEVSRPSSSDHGNWAVSLSGIAVERHLYSHALKALTKSKSAGNTSLLLPHLPDYLCHIRSAAPADMKQSLVHYVSESDISFFQWIESQPKALERFSASMAADTRFNQMEIQATLCSLLPENEVPEGNGLLSEEGEVLLVDVGGGRGQALADLRRARPDLRGRLIVQDLPQEVEGRDVIDGVEAMPHDFFTPQPIKGRIKCLHLHSTNLAETAQSHRFCRRPVG